MLRNPHKSNDRRAHVINEINSTGATVNYVPGAKNNLADFFSRNGFPKIDLANIHVIFFPDLWMSFQQTLSKIDGNVAPYPLQYFEEEEFRKKIQEKQKKHDQEIHE